jgi:hypothetical protein
MQVMLEGCAEPVPAEEGETLLAALLRAGLPFPFSCQTGSCGTCGRVLACRTLLRGDAAVRRID